MSLFNIRHFSAENKVELCFNSRIFVLTSTSELCIRSKEEHTDNAETNQSMRICAKKEVALQIILRIRH